MLTITDKLRVGVAKIDEQHQILFDRINALTDMGLKSFEKAETEKTLDLLTNYTVFHFGDEEVLQRQYNYPKHEWHKGQHQHFVDGLKKLKAEFAANGPSAKFTMDVNNLVIKWLVNHIEVVDVELGKFIRGEITL